MDPDSALGRGQKKRRPLRGGVAALELAALHFLEEVLAVEIVVVFGLLRQGIVVVLAGAALGEFLGLFDVLPDKLCELFFVHAVAGGEGPGDFKVKGECTACRAVPVSVPLFTAGPD